MDVYILMEDDDMHLPILASFKKKDILTWLKNKGYKYNKEHEFYYLFKEDGIYDSCVSIEKTKMITIETAGAINPDITPATAWDETKTYMDFA